MAHSKVEQVINTHNVVEMEGTEVEHSVRR
jgi:hypothetical protein